MTNLNEIEVSVFGQGYGESVLIHIGNNDWIIIDSCADNSKSTPVALEYVRSLGLDPGEVIKLIVISHWHDDHIRGMGMICRECKSAKIIFSSALNCKEFLTLAEVYKGGDGDIIPRGLREFSKVIEGLIETKGRDRISWAIADRPVWDNHKLESEKLWPCNIVSLSPSDHSFTLAQERIADLIYGNGDSTGVLMSNSINPNHISVVIHIVIGDIVVLLGGDLEETKDERTGWNIIVSSSRRPKAKAHIFKIPHHGSKTADNCMVWKEMVHPAPLSLVTSFNWGKCSLPNPDDIKRISAKSSRAFLSGQTKCTASKGRSRLVEKTIKESGAKIYPASYGIGQIKITIDPKLAISEWKSELTNGAIAI